MNIREAIHQTEIALRAYLARDERGMPLIPIESQRPIYLLGAPGVGKTAAAEEVARRLDVGLVSYTLTHHTRQSALGLPQIVARTFEGREMAVTEYTTSEIIAGVYRYMEETGRTRGILFLDEINCVSETLLPAIMELLQHKRFGEQRVPDSWMIVCAGNPEKFNRSARTARGAGFERVAEIRRGNGRKPRDSQLSDAFARRFLPDCAGRGNHAAQLDRPFQNDCGAGNARRNAGGGAIRAISAMPGRL